MHDCQGHGNKAREGQEFTWYWSSQAGGIHRQPRPYGIIEADPGGASTDGPEGGQSTVATSLSLAGETKVRGGQSRSP